MALVLDVDLHSRPTRYLVAVLCFCLSLFVAALAIGILSARIEAPPLLAWMLRGCILLMFGGIAVGSAVGAVRALSGEDAKTRGVPPEVLVRCLTCGEGTPSDAPCPLCAEPPHDRAGAFTVKRQGILGAAFGAALFGASVCLGFFILVGPYYDGERRVWALIAFGALGLFLLTVGVAGLWGALGVLRLDEVISVEALEGSSPAQEYVAIVGRFFARWLREPVSLVHLRHALDADPAHRAQAEAHARALRERGVPVSSELVEAILGRASG